MAPSPLLSQQIITLATPNGFQNVIKHKINKKDETMIINRCSIFKDSKISCTEIYGAFQQTWFWLKCRFTGLWLHMPIEKLAFHSIQQNINSLLICFTYMSICICLYLCMIKWMCALPQKNLTEGTSAYAYHFSVAVVKRGAWKIKKINDKLAS